MKRHDRAGFTVLELLISIAVFTILIAVLLPAVHSVHESSRCDVGWRISFGFDAVSMRHDMADRGDGNEPVRSCSAAEYQRVPFRAERCQRASHVSLFCDV